MYPRAFVGIVLVFGLSTVLLPRAVRGAEITTCGQSIHGLAELAGDLDCSGFDGPRPD